MGCAIQLPNRGAYPCVTIQPDDLICFYDARQGYNPVAADVLNFGELLREFLMKGMHSTHIIRSETFQSLRGAVDYVEWWCRPFQT